MTKSEAMAHWRELAPNQNPLPCMDAIPYKSVGSSYGACGVRVDGNAAFVDAVLSCLKQLLEGENVNTRLELSRQVVDGKGLGKSFQKAGEGAEVCYIRLHERGRQALSVEAPPPRKVVPPESTVISDREKVLTYLKNRGGAASIDTIVNATGIGAGPVGGILMIGIVSDEVTRLPGSMYSAK